MSDALNKSPEQLTPSEWEQLCDHCGICCLHKIEDEDTGKVYFTHIVCQLYDLDEGGCQNYNKRKKLVPNCIKLSPQNVMKIDLPASCAYRLKVEGKELPSWHHLQCGDPKKIHQDGHSILGKVFSEKHIHPDDFQDYIMDLNDE